MTTWIKLFRDIEKWEWYTDIPTKSLFIHLLIKARYVDHTWRGILIKRGQLLTGRVQLAKETGLSEQQVRTALNKLKKGKKSNQEIECKATNKYTMITVCNYELYQDKKNEEQPAINQQPNQKITTSKERKKEKKRELAKKFSEESLPYRFSMALYKSIKRRDPNFKEPNIQNWCIEADRMFRIDERPEEEIHIAFQFYEKTPFWHPNILSTKKFRNQLPTLINQANSRDGNGI